MEVFGSNIQIESLTGTELVRLSKLVLRLADYCDEHSLSGVSAVELGEKENVFVVRDHNGNLCPFMNGHYEPLMPRIESVEKEAGKTYKVNRYRKIELFCYVLHIDESYNVQFLEYNGISKYPYSIAFQRCIDYANGVCVKDIGKEIPNVKTKRT